MGACRDAGGRGTNRPRRCPSRTTGYAVASRFFDSPQMRFNIADAHVSALLLAGQIDGWARDGTTRAEAKLPRCRGHHSWSAPRSSVEPRSSRAGSTRPVHCWETQRPLCRRRGMRWAGDIRYHIPYATALAMRGATDEAAAVLTALDEVSAAIPQCWTTSAAWPVHGWRPGRAPSPRRSPRCCRPPKPPRPRDNSPPRCYACRPPSSSGITPLRLG